MKTQSTLRIKILSFLPAGILFTILPVLRTDISLDPNLHIQFIGLSMVLLFFWIFCHFQSGILISDKYVLLFLSAGAWYLIYSLFTVIISINRPDGFFVFLKYVLFLGLLATLILLQPARLDFVTLSRFLIILCWIILVPAFVQLIGLIHRQELVIPLSTYQLRSVFPHRNLLAEMLVLLLPFLVFNFFKDKNFFRYASLPGIAASLFFLVILSNRAAWLAVVALLLLVPLFVVIKGLRIERRKLTIMIVLGVIVVSSGMLFLTSYSQKASLWNHVSSSVSVKEGSTKDRLGLWNRTTGMIAENPLTGKGLGSWKIHILKYGHEGLVSENNTTFYQRPHNDFLWIGSEQGMIGLVSYLSLFGIMLIFMLRKRKEGSIYVSPASLLLTFAVTSAFLVLSVFSFPRERISHNILLFSSWGILLGQVVIANSEKTREAFSSRVTRLVIVTILIGILIVGFFRLNGDIHIKKAIYYKKRAQFSSCIREIQRAESVFYRMDEMSTPIQWYAGISFFRLKKYSEAVNCFGKAIKRNPYHIYVLNDYAGALVKTGHPDSAAEYYRQAIELAPNFNEPRLNQCALLFNKGAYEEAFNLLRKSDITDSTQRYLRTVMLVTGKFIEQKYSLKQLSDQFWNQYKEQKGNYEFYRNVLLHAARDSMQTSEFFTRISDTTL